MLGEDGIADEDEAVPPSYWPLPEDIDDIAEDLEAVVPVAEPPDVYLDESPDPAELEGPHDLLWYWQRITPMLDKAYSGSGIMLLCDDGDGVFRLKYDYNIDPRYIEECSILRADKLFQQFPARKKILYVKEAALQNRTLIHAFPYMPAFAADQMVILPVTQNSEVIALLVIARAAGSKILDQAGLQELRNFSKL
jgi:hypothetical protein